MTALLSRRALMGAGAGLVGASMAGVADARILPKDMVPLIGPGYRAVDQDEKGMWQQMERVEEEVSGSNLLIKDPQLTGYLGDLIGRVGGPAARDMRIYLARIPEFNAVMFPTGFAVVFSGLLLRMRNEAQLAGVVAHESAHFLRKHQLRQWRDMRRKTDVFSILAMGAGIAGGVTGTTWATSTSWRSWARSCRCSNTTARWRPRQTRWACGCWPSPATTRWP
jgi:predicted Zn-dependent protease